MERFDLEKILKDQRVDIESQDLGISRSVDIASHFNLPAVSVITGVRRCGKSRLLRQIMEESRVRGFNTFYLNLDDPRLSEMIAKDFSTVYEIWLATIANANTKLAILLDEVQMVAGWEKWANFFSQNKGHKVFVTGSNSRMLSSELGSILTGRHLDIHLTPLSFAEMCVWEKMTPAQSSSTDDSVRIAKLFEKFVNYGGFPRPYLDQNMSYLPHYYDDIVQKDIMVRAKIRNKTALLSVAKLLATETSRLVNHSKIARFLHLKDEATVRKYCQKFVETFLYYEVRCFARSLRSQQRSHPKYYAVDHALAKSNGFWKTEDPSRILELIVCAELFRRHGQVFYWKSKKNYEVDFLQVHGTEPTSATQVSFSISDFSTEEREVRALIAARTELGIKDLFIITMHERRVIKTAGCEIKVIPVIEFLIG